MHEAKPVRTGAKNHDKTMGTMPLYGGKEEGSSEIHRTPSLPLATKAKPGNFVW